MQAHASVQALALEQSHALDLTPEQLQRVRGILRENLCSVDAAELPAGGFQAWVFGSRATGRARPYSDLDILIARAKPLDWRERADLCVAFEPRFPVRAQDERERVFEAVLRQF
jgi:predicted nucleotidyltransferase